MDIAMTLFVGMSAAVMASGAEAQQPEIIDGTEITNVNGIVCEVSADCDEETDMLFSSAESEGDIISINISSFSQEPIIKYGNVVLLEDSSTESILYFKAVSSGKDNIIISEITPCGMVIREYAVTIDDDLNAEVYEVNLPVMPY